MWYLVLIASAITFFVSEKPQQLLKDRLLEKKEEIFGTSSWKLKISSFPLTECSSWSGPAGTVAPEMVSYFTARVLVNYSCVYPWRRGSWRARVRKGGRGKRLWAAPAAEPVYEWSCWGSQHQMLPELMSRGKGTTYGNVNMGSNLSSNLSNSGQDHLWPQKWMEIQNKR